MSTHEAPTTARQALCPSVTDRRDKVHRIRQHIINLDRSPRDIFDHRRLAEEWESLASMSNMHHVGFFAYLCRAKRASQMHRADLVLRNVQGAIDSILDTLKGNQPLSPSSDLLSLGQYVSDLYHRLEKTLKGNRDCKETCPYETDLEGRTCNCIINCRNEDDLERAYRAELMKDLPQVLELLATYFFNKSAESSNVGDIESYVELALHSVFLALRSVVLELRSNTNSWCAPTVHFSPQQNLHRTAELLKISRRVLVGICAMGNEGQEQPLHCCHYKFDKDPCLRPSSGIPDSRRRSALHLVLLTMRIALLLLKRVKGECVVVGEILKFAQVLDGIAKKGQMLYHIPIWTYPFAGDACLYIARYSHCAAHATEARKLGIDLHRANVARVMQEHNPHSKRNGAKFTADAAATLENLLGGNDPPPRRDGNIIYSLTRIARAELFSRKSQKDKRHPHDVPLLDSLLDELRFEYDAMFWSAIDNEARFLQLLSSSSATRDNALPSGSIVYDGASDVGNPVACPYADKKIQNYHFDMQQVPSGRSDENASRLEIHILRSWSSYTPFITRDWREGEPSRQSRGGGYLIRWKNVGIAVDPGPGFVANLLDAGLSVSDIHVVFVTHNHPDHFSDLVPLLTLAERKGHMIRHIYLAPNAYRLQKDSVQESLKESRARTVNGLEIQPFCHNMVLRIPAVHDSDWALVCAGVPALHNDIGAKRKTQSQCRCHLPAYGLLVTVEFEGRNRFRVYFTGDTAWEWPAKNKGAGGPGKVFHDWVEEITKRVDTDLLVAHMSKVEFSEIARGKYYGQHLGVLGCAELIKRFKPKLAIISEWGEEYSGYRASICRAIGRAIETELGGKEFRCLPGDRGLKIAASADSDRKLWLCCSHREAMGDLCSDRVLYDKVHIDRQFVAGEERISYLCERHRSL